MNSKWEPFVSSLILSDDVFKKVSAIMLDEMHKGLAASTKSESSLKMINTYVTSLPTGQESGQYLALDLGGTNFRVLVLKIDDGNVTSVTESYAIPQEIMLGTGTQLFDHIAECLAHFVSKHKLDGRKLPLGFTFSFPCNQESLTRARLISWTKGFRCNGVEGEDVVGLLREAVQRRKDISIDVTAVLNDTTGTLVSCAYNHLKCRIGLIVGTGTNACYVERLENVPGSNVDGSNLVVINVEWGAFGDNGSLSFIVTEYDDEIDKISLNAGEQRYEKMISGMYLGELVRLILVKIADDGHVFDGKASQDLLTPGLFSSQYVSACELDVDDDVTKTKEVLRTLGVANPSVDDCNCVKYVCSVVSARAARLCAAGVSALLKKIDEADVTIGIDGSVYKYHPKFSSIMEEKLSELVPEQQKFNLVLSEDGSGRGAALVAAITSS